MSKENPSVSLLKILDESDIKYKLVQNVGKSFQNKLKFLGEICGIKFYKNGTKYIFQENDKYFLVSIKNSNQEEFISDLVLYFLSSNFFNTKLPYNSSKNAGK